MNDFDLEVIIFVFVCIVSQIISGDVCYPHQLEKDVSLYCGHPDTCKNLREPDAAVNIDNQCLLLYGPHQDSNYFGASLNDINITQISVSYSVSISSFQITYSDLSSVEYGDPDLTQGYSKTFTLSPDEHICAVSLGHGDVRVEANRHVSGSLSRLELFTNQNRAWGPVGRWPVTDDCIHPGNGSSLTLVNASGDPFINSVTFGFHAPSDLTEWSAWSPACEPACGVGNQERHRTCSADHPLCHNAICNVHMHEDRTCADIPPRLLVAANTDTTYIVDADGSTSELDLMGKVHSLVKSGNRLYYTTHIYQTVLDHDACAGVGVVMDSFTTSTFDIAVDEDMQQVIVTVQYDGIHAIDMQSNAKVELYDTYIWGYGLVVDINTKYAYWTDGGTKAFRRINYSDLANPTGFETLASAKNFRGLFIDQSANMLYGLVEAGDIFSFDLTTEVLTFAIVSRPSVYTKAQGLVVMQGNFFYIDSFAETIWSIPMTATDGSQRVRYTTEFIGSAPLGLTII